MTVEATKETAPALDGSRRKQAERRETAEQALLAAAVHLIAKHGVKGATLADLGKAAGYSKGLPGHYFKSKEKLLESVLEYIEEHFSEQMAATGSLRGGIVSVTNTINALLIPTHMEITKAFTLLQKEALMTNSKLRPIIQRHNRKTIDRLAGEIQTGIENGEIRSNVDPKAEAILILAGIRGVNSLWATNPDAVVQETLRAEMMSSVRRLLSKHPRKAVP